MKFCFFYVKIPVAHGKLLVAHGELPGKKITDFDMIPGSFGLLWLTSINFGLLW